MFKATVYSNNAEAYPLMPPSQTAAVLICIAVLVPVAAYRVLVEFYGIFPPTPFPKITIKCVEGAKT